MSDHPTFDFDGGPGDTSRESSVDSLDLESFLIDLDEQSANNHVEELTTPLKDIWDVPDSPPPELLTPDTSNPEEEPTPDDKAKDEPVVDSDDWELIKYHLRPQSREHKSAFTRTWMDKDDSGNYGEKDPAEEARKTKRRRSRVKFKPYEDADLISDATEGDKVQGERPVKVIPKLVISFKFESDEMREQFKKTLNAPPKQPKDAPEDPNFKGYRLRKRGSCASTKYFSECNLDKSHFDPDLPDDLTGHPSARGCWECLALGIRCPLLDDERGWPCATCFDDNHDCVLITQPKFKRSCEKCKSRKTQCSYTYTYEHGQPCQQCMDGGHDCIAGPAKDTIQERIRYDRVWENDPLVKQKPFKPRKAPSPKDSPRQSTLDNFITSPEKAEPKCVQALKDVKGRSKVTEVNEGTADMDEDPCVRNRVPSTNDAHGRKRHLHHRDRQEPRPLKYQKMSKASRGRTHTIQTKFCHPIIFNHDDDGVEPCHFCSDPSYAIFGLGPKEVEVIEWQDGRGLEEVSGGHRGEGVQNTRVCIVCTTSRVPIIMCRNHELMPLQNSGENEKLDENDAFDELLSGSGKLKGKWCSICANLAKYECCTAGDDGAGCGLLACETCMALLAGMYDGDLQKMLPEMSDESTSERMLGLRADYELLREDGLLIKFVLWNSLQ